MLASPNTSLANTRACMAPGICRAHAQSHSVRIAWHVQALVRSPPTARCALPSTNHFCASWRHKLTRACLLACGDGDTAVCCR
jgi:hypothetical protein